MTQEAAYSLEIVGSSETVKALQLINQLIRENAKEIKEQQKAADSLRGTLNELNNQNAKLKTQSEAVEKELVQVTTRMKELREANKQASNEYKELKTRKGELVTQSEKLTKQLYNNEQQIKKTSEKVNQLTTDEQKLIKEQIKLKEESTKASKALRDQEKAFQALHDNVPKDSIIGLGREVARLTKEYKLLSEVQRNSPMGKQMAADILNTKNKFDALNRSIGDYKSSIGDYRGALSQAGLGLASFGKAALGAFGVGSGIQLGAQLLRNAVSTVNEYQKAIHELSSVTNITGDDLTRVASAAEKISNLYGTNVVDVLKEIQLLVSARPQLLGDVEGITLLTEKVEVLSKAGLIPAEQAANALTTSLAQFALENRDAQYVIDVLATGAQLGAAQIDDLTLSMQKAGGTARSVGLNLNETTAIFEGMAKNGIKAEDAGIKLRNILGFLAKSSRVELNPTLTDVKDVLNTLASEVTTVSSAVSKFGVENQEAALAIVQNKDFIIEMIDKLDEYGKAQELAATNTDTLATSFDKMTAAWDNFIVSIEDGEGVVGGAVQLMLNQLTDGLKILSGDASTKDIFKQIFGINLFENITGIRAERDKIAADAKKDSEKILNDLLNADRKLREQGKKTTAVLGQLKNELDDLDRLNLAQLKALRKDLGSTELTAENRAEIMKRYAEVTAAIDKWKHGNADGVDSIKKKIGELKNVLENTTNKTVIQNTTEQIFVLEKKLADITAAMKLAKLEFEVEQAGGIAGFFQKEFDKRFGSGKKPELKVAVKPAFEEKDTLITPDDIKQKEIAATGVLEEPGAEVKSAAVIAKENEEAALIQAQIDGAHERKAQRAIDQAEEIEAYEKHFDSLSELVGGFGDVISGFISGNAEQQHEAFKQLLLQFLKYTEAEINIALAASQTKAALAAAGVATVPGLGALALAKLTATLALTKALVSGAFAIIRGAVAGFEEGGEVKADMGIPFKKKGSKDDRLVHVGVGEVILNKKQQAKLQSLTSKTIFGDIGVRGFAAGAANNYVREQNELTAYTTIPESQMKTFAKTIARETADAVLDKHRELERKRIAGIL